MKFIRPSYEIVEQKPGIQGIYDIIEYCGKISYKSQPMGGDVAKKFVEARTNEKHGAVLEFGTVYLKVKLGSPSIDHEYVRKSDVVHRYRRNKYSRVVDERETFKDNGKPMTEIAVYYITTNYRVVVENGWLDDLDCYFCETPEEKHEKRYTVKFITDIGVGREFLRHRTMSMVQESTRYVNYTKEKFGGECTFIIPSWITSDELPTDGKSVILTDELEDLIIELGSIEHIYKKLIKKGWTPQQARIILPLSTKTEFALCGFKDDWAHFFRLRSDIAATGKPHPQAQELANPLREEFIEKKFVTRELLEN